jgi:hypothetical protein
VHRSKSGPPMSALGHKRTSPLAKAMSALPPKADKQQTSRRVRFVPQAVISRSLFNHLVDLREQRR